MDVHKEVTYTITMTGEESARLTRALARMRSSSITCSDYNNMQVAGVIDTILSFETMMNNARED